MTLRSKDFDSQGENFESETSSEYHNPTGLTKEQILYKNINKIAKECVEIEKIKRDFVDIIIENFKELDFSELLRYPKFLIKEASLKITVSDSNLRGLNVVSVDGSSVVKNFLNVDFSFLKAIAVKYCFKENYNAHIEYFPDLSGFNNYKVKSEFMSLEEALIERKISMEMTLMEISLLNELINKSSDIDLIILDGSVVVTPINLLFSKDLEISLKYDSLLKEYHKLYENCNEKNIILIGSIKDTRTRALTHLLRDSISYLKPSQIKLRDFLQCDYRNIFNYFTDMDLFNRILKLRERSCIFNCKREIEKIRDTGVKKEIPYYFPYEFYAFYLKTSKYDTPCRIEFYINEKHDIKEASDKADLISKLILPISCLNDYYGLPIPQIEAHKRAVFNQSEIQLLFNNLKRKLNLHGIHLIEKRRNRRPF